MQNLYQVDPKTGKVQLNLHPGQTRAWESVARFVFVVAGTQSGKTSFGPWWLWREIMTVGGGDHLAVTSTFDLFKLKMLPEMRNVFEHTLGIGRYWRGDRVMEIANPATGKFEANKSGDAMWGRIILRSAEAGGGLESASAKSAWLDECGQDSFTLETFEAVLRRLSLSRGRVLGTTTPYNLGWLKTRIVDKADSDPDVDVVNFSSTLNPQFSKEEYEERRQTMPAWRFKMFYDGLMGRPAGLIYEAFMAVYRQDGGHLVQRFDVPTTWARYVGVDPGGVNTAKVWLAHDASADVYYLYRESLDGGKSSKQHAQEAKRLADSRGERVVGWMVGNKGEVQVRMDWQAWGVSPVKAPDVTDVEAGIDRVIQLFKEHRMYVIDDCTLILDELSRYARVVDAAGNPTEKIKDKEKFHMLDALRYAVIGVTSPSGVLFG